MGECIIGGVGGGVEIKTGLAALPLSNPIDLGGIPRLLVVSILTNATTIYGQGAGTCLASSTNFVVATQGNSPTSLGKVMATATGFLYLDSGMTPSNASLGYFAIM